MIYKYKGYFDCESVCDISIKNKYMVVATEISENRGTSITNMVEDLAFHVCNDFNIKPKDLIWIEHYPDSILGETYAIVTFKYKNHEFLEPKWRYISKKEFCNLVNRRWLYIVRTIMYGWYLQINNIVVISIEEYEKVKAILIKMI